MPSLTCSQIWFIHLVDDCHCGYITKWKTKPYIFVIYIVILCIFQVKKSTKTMTLSYVTSQNITFLKWNDICLSVTEWGGIVQNAQRRSIDKWCCICKIVVHINVELDFKFLFKQKHGRAMRFTNLLNVSFVKVRLVPLFRLDSFLCCFQELQRVPFKYGVWRKFWNFLGCLLFVRVLQILMTIFIHSLHPNLQCQNLSPY